jgi:hypothetical protein
MTKQIRNRRSSGNGSTRLRALRAAISATEVVPDFAFGHPGNLKSDCSPADIASARLWLAEGAPIADVLTMLESRHRFDLSSADCRAYAIEIVWAVQQLSLNDSEPIPNPKESAHAIA